MAALIEPLFIGLLLYPIWAMARRNFMRAFAYGVFVCVSMPTFLRIQTNGAIPELTIHRLVLISLFINWVKQPGKRPLREIPLFGAFCFWAFVNAISLLCTSIDFTDSLKQYLDFVIEVGVFYVIASTTVRSREDAILTIRAAVSGMAIVAFFGAVEHYTLFNPVDEFIPNYVRAEGAGHDVLSTYQHRILLGLGMAMGWPLCIALLRGHTGGFPGRKMLWIFIALLVATCFFAQSRGPWLACVIVLGVLMLLGTKRLRKTLIFLPILAVLTFAIKPGVLDSLTTSAQDTMDADSFKGGTFQYRLELWKVAWAQVSKSPLRTLIGYGPGSGRQVDIQWDLSYRNWSLTIDSWDSYLAYDLFRSGVLGSIASAFLFLGMWWRLFKATRRVTGDDRDLLVCLLGCVSAFVFMMTNTYNFERALDYLLWSVVASAFAISASVENSAVAPTEVDETQPIESSEPVTA